LNLTYIGYNEGCNDCTSLSGFTVQLKANDSCIPDHWTYTASASDGCFAPWVDPLTGHTYGPRWTLLCPPKDPESLENWILGIALWDLTDGSLVGMGACASGTLMIDHGTILAITADPEQSTCNPLSLVFEVDTLDCIEKPHDPCPDPPAAPGSCPDVPAPPDPPDYHAGLASYTNCPDSACEQCGKIWPLKTWHRRHYKIIITE
jgi:hypothetical protein